MALFLVNNLFGNTSPTICLREHSCTIMFIFMATFNVSTLDTHLEAIRQLSSEEVLDFGVHVLPLDQLPLDYLQQLDDDDQTTTY
jgi:hypothetical protein